MAIVLDTSANFLTAGFSAGPTTSTNSYTVTGTNPGLAVWIPIWQDVGGTGTITTCTYNGVSLTRAFLGVHQGSMTGEWWYMAAPPTGAHTLVAILTGATDGFRVMPISFSGVAQTTPLGAVATQTAGSTATNPTIGITNTVGGSVVLAGLSRFGNTAITASTFTNAQRANVSNVTAVTDYLITSTTGLNTATETGAVANDEMMGAIELLAASGAPAVNKGAAFLPMMGA